MMLFGFLMPGIDNYAHAGGFGGGYLAARLLDPLKPERIDHIAHRGRVPGAVARLGRRVGLLRAAIPWLTPRRAPNSRARSRCAASSA